MTFARTVLLLLVVPLWASNVEARGTEASDVSTSNDGASSTQAQAAFDEGIAAADAGDFARALSSFERSQALEPAPGTRLNLGRCKEMLARYAAAIADFEAVARDLPADDERALYARGRLQALEARVAHVTLSLSPRAQGAHVSIDGVELAPLALERPVPLDAGPHEISVLAKGRDPEVIDLTLVAGDRKEVVLQGGLEKPFAAAPKAWPPSTPSRGRASTQRMLGFGGLGLGVAGLATSAVTGLLALDSKKTMDTECDGSKCSPEGLEASDSGERMATISTAAFGAGLVFLGAGAALLYFDGSKGQKRVGIAPLRDGATLFVGGSL